MAISSKEIIERAAKRVKLREDKDSKDWIEEYNKLSISSRITLFEGLNKVQAIFIKDMMGKLENPIQIGNLGSFYYKQAKKDWYDIREENPNKPVADVIDEVKDRYHKRIEHKKRLKKLVKNKMIVLPIKK